MQSSIASALCESIGVTKGFALPEEETPSLAEPLRLIEIKRIAEETLRPMCCRYLIGNNSGLFGSLNLHVPVHFVLLPSTTLLPELCF